MTRVTLPDVPFGTAIPAKLFQVFLGDPLPDALRRNVEALAAANPGWTHRLFDDAAADAFVREHYGRDVHRLYARINPAYGAARADLFRYLLLYREGGVYLDAKSRFTVPIDQAIRGDEGYILSQWDNRAGTPHAGWGVHDALGGLDGGEFQQWHVIAAPGHPFLRAVIERVLTGIERYSVARYDVGWTGVLHLTGPVAYTCAILPLVGRYPHRRIPDERAIHLDYNVLGGSAHKGLAGPHYTERLDPVVCQPGWRGLRDRLHVRARAWRKRYASPSMEGTGAAAPTDPTSG